MFRNAIDQDEINIFSGCSNLYLYIRKISNMHLVFVKQGQFYLSFPAVTQFGDEYPFIMVQQLAFCGQANHIILPHGIQFQKHFVIIIPTIHDKSCFPKQSGSTFYSRESNCINGSKVLLF